MPLLIGLLDSPDEELAGTAAGVLTEIVSKRMDSAAKLQLVQRLGIAPVAARWAEGFDARTFGDTAQGSNEGSSGSEDDFAGKTARLLAALVSGMVS